MRLALTAVLAGAVLAVSATPASATLVFTGAVSGSYDQQWQVANPADACVSGGGEQSVQFSSAPNLRLAGGISDDGGNRHSNGRPWQFGPFRVTGTITRTDNTATLASADCLAQQPLPPHDCGGPRHLTLRGVYIYKTRGARSASFHMALGNLDTKIAALFAGATQCFAPREDQIGHSTGFTGPWPGDRRMTTLHRTTALAGDEPYGPLSGSPDHLRAGPPVRIDATTTFSWKAVLTSERRRRRRTAGRRGARSPSSQARSAASRARRARGTP